MLDLQITRFMSCKQKADDDSVKVTGAMIHLRERISQEAFDGATLFVKAWIRVALDAPAIFRKVSGEKSVLQSGSSIIHETVK